MIQACYLSQVAPLTGAALMNTATNPDTSSSIVPAIDDLHDRAYRFGQPVTYLSERQHVRLFILRSRLQQARALRPANG
jgi:hypothetical protein